MGWAGAGRRQRGRAARAARAGGVLPRGMMNMLATECSRPSAMKAEMGNQIATILPGRSLANDAMYTAW